MGGFPFLIDFLCASCIVCIVCLVCMLHVYVLLCYIIILSGSSGQCAICLVCLGYSSLYTSIDSVWSRKGAWQRSRPLSPEWPAAAPVLAVSETCTWVSEVEARR